MAAVHFRFEYERIFINFLLIETQNKMTNVTAKCIWYKSISEHMLKYILVKKYLKYTLFALKIPTTSKRGTITIFTH